MMMENPAIRKKSLAEELAARLQEQIAAGTFGIGEKLPPEPELMRIFGVGRSTVREAVRILSDMGLLRVRQGAGTFVVSRNAPDLMTQRLKRADIRELDEVRRILEAAIVEKAAERYTEQDAFRTEGLPVRTERGGRNGPAGTVHRRRREPPRDYSRSDAQRNSQRYSTGRPQSICGTASNVSMRIRATCSHRSPPHDRLAAFILAHDTRNALKTIRIILEEP